MKIKIAICLVVSVLVCACSSTNQCKVPKQEGVSLQQKRDKKIEFVCTVLFELEIDPDELGGQINPGTTPNSHY